MRAIHARAQLKYMNFTMIAGKRRDNYRRSSTDNGDELRDDALIIDDIGGNIIMDDDNNNREEEEEGDTAAGRDNDDDNSANFINGEREVLMGMPIIADTDNHHPAVLPANDIPSWIDLNNNMEFHQGFNIVHQSKWMTMKDDALPNDACEPLFPGSSLTKKDFCNSFQTFVAEEGLTNVASHKLLKLLKLWLPLNSNLPVQQFASGSFKSTIADYEPSAESRLIAFDCCRHGHCVFTGSYANSIECHQCKEPRFHPCTARGCQSKNVAYKNCPHPFTTRSAKSIVYYRPLLPLLKDLLKTKMFVESLKYKHLNPYGTLVPNTITGFQQKRTYSDIMDSALAVTHLKEMEERFRSRARQRNEEMIPVSLLLGYNYDGVQPFSSKVADFWPMTLSILNLPPNLRKKVGMGMFILSIYSMGKETYVEDFLHRDCFIRELLFLYDGYEMKVNDKIYFLQARLICHGYDTKAAEHVLRVQASGSLAGCPFCRLINGSRKKWSGSVFFAGHRRLLPLQHFLRSRGQSQQCCPEGFYSADAPASLELMTPVSHNWDGGVGLGCNDLHNERKPLENLRLCCSSASSTTVKNFLRNAKDNTSFIWYHDSKYKPNDFMGSLYYYHMDYRDQVPYNRVTNDTYIQDGIAAIQSKAPVNGVKGLWLFRYLPYADIATQVNWDPFHTLMNVARNVISIWKGTRPVITDSLLAYFRHTKSHPDVWNRSSGSTSKSSASSCRDNHTIVNKWKIPASSEAELNSLDRYFEALLIPKGFNKDFEAHEVFSQTGYMKGYTAIQFVEVLMDYFVHTVLYTMYRNDYPDALMKFLVLLSEDFSWLLSTNPFSDEDIDKLFYRIVELVELHQGLYPTSEALIVYHQLIDLPHHIRQLGPLRNWWTLAAERFMSKVKEGLPDGGRSYITTVIRRHVNSELQGMNDYNNYSYYTAEEMKHLTISSCSRNALYPSTFFNIVNTEGKLSAIYCDRFSKLMMQDVSGSLELSHHEYHQLLLFLANEAPFICGSDVAALQNSPLYRLHCAFIKHKDSKLWTSGGKNKQLNNFDTWLLSIGSPEGRDGCINKKIFIDNQQQPISTINQNSLHHNVVECGKIYQSDWLFCKKLNEHEALYRTVEVVYKKCLANGVIFASRGQFCRETTKLIVEQGRWGQQTPDTKPSNPFNRCLADHCHKANDYSSWCRIYVRQPSGENDYEEFGQFNFFFRSRLPCEERVLNNIPVASICKRKTERRGRNLFAVKARDSEYTRDHIETTLKPDLFCAVYKVYPTPIIIAAMDSRLRPISRSSIIGRDEEATNSIDILLLIQMFRHRTMNFNPTFPDLATMQLLTSSCNDHP